MPIGATEQEEDKMEIRMTGMIDVVFLLLIFFIVTMQIPEPEVMIETEIPQAEDAGESTAVDDDPDDDFEDLRLQIVWDETRQQSSLRLNQQPIPGQSQLLGRLRMLHRMLPDGRVVIVCDDDVPYDDLIQTISTVQMTELPMAFADL